MEKQTMFMLKCLVEGKNIPGRRHGQNGQKKETGICLLNAQLVRESNP